MKAVKILTHPYTLIISFLFVLISGEHLGGFYLLYLLLALPHGGIHTLLAALGIGLLLFSYHKYGRRATYLAASLTNVFGALMLVLSLFLFFYNDKQEYNYGTFYQVVPLITLILYSLLTLCFLVNNLLHGFHRKPLSSSP